MPQTTLRFTRLRLENWRNFRQVDIELAERVFLVGPNASGKSNFLDAFRFLHDVVSSHGFQPAVELHGGVSRLRNLSAPDDAEVMVAVAIGSDDRPALWTYEVRFRQAPSGRPILTAERVQREGVEILLRPDDADRQDPLRLTQTALEQISLNKDFREISHFLLTVFYLHIIPHLVREPDRSTGKTADPLGEDFLYQMADVPSDLLRERLDWLEGILSAAVPQIGKLDIARNGSGRPHLLALHRPSGRWQTEADFSDGTLRLIGFLWAHLVQPSGPLILEEPEISLHPEIVRRLPQVFARIQSQEGQQILLSSHSPEILQDEGIGLDEVLLLFPHQEGTEVRTAASFQEVPLLLEGGVPLADAILPKTRPEGVERLASQAGRG